MAEPVFRVPSVPRSTSKEVEQRNTSRLLRDRTRNAGGTVDLKTLAQQALSRLRSGTPHGTAVKQTADEAFHQAEHDHFPALSYPACPHVNDEELAYWRAENPKFICARCWLHRQRELEADGGAAAKPLRRLGAARNPRGADD